MKHYLEEDQYRVIGFDVDGSAHISWADTANQAIEKALTYFKARVVRPDGSVLGEVFDRYFQSKED